MPRPDSVIVPDLLAEWCRTHLGSQPSIELFQAAHLSSVVGLRLADGREVVVKSRPSASRVGACVEVQRRMFAAGYPCAEPLAGPAPLGDQVATAEAFVDSASPSQMTGGTACSSAAAFASLIAVAPRPADVGVLTPRPSWAAWDHAGPGVWPDADDLDVDLNAFAGPSWLDLAAALARDRLRQDVSEPVVGHCDWIPENVVWRDGALHVVHDWDSAIAEAEEVLVGYAAALYSSSPSVAETEDFLRAYSDHRGEPLTPVAVERAWAAGVWTRAVDAKYQHATGQNATSLTETQARERLSRAGVQMGALERGPQ